MCLNMQGFGHIKNRPLYDKTEQIPANYSSIH